MTKDRIMFSNYRNRLGFGNRLGRGLWQLCWVLLFRYTPNRPANFWRVWLLRRFGARIGINCSIAPSVEIWAPWNLIMHDNSLIARRTRCYNPATVELHSQCIVSENVFLCTASHDVHSPRHELVTKPIVLCDQVWIAADAFIGMGVTVNTGAVVGARSCVFKDVPPWTVVGGNPAEFIKKRDIRS